MITCEVEGCFEDAQVYIPEYNSRLCIEHLLISLTKECMLHVMNIDTVEEV